MADVACLCEGFDSQLTGVRNRLCTQFGRYLRWPSVEPGPLKQGEGIDNLSGLPEKAAMLTHWIVTSWHF